MPKGFTYLFDANAVREARLDAGLSLTEVADRTGYAEGGLRATENIRRDTPTNRAMLQALSDLYSVEERTLVRTKHGRHIADLPRADAPRRKRKTRNRS